MNSVNCSCEMLWRIEKVKVWLEIDYCWIRDVKLDSWGERGKKLGV